MFGHFGFQCCTVGKVRRVGNDEVDLAVELGKQPRLSHVGVDEFDGRSGGVASGGGGEGAGGVASGGGGRGGGVVDRDDAGGGPVLRERHRERAGARAQVDDDRPLRE